MSVKESLELILTEYPKEMEKPFGDNPLAILIRNQIPREVSEVLPNTAMYSVEASPGKGNWAKVPWVAILNNHVTTTPEKGYYPVYLFKSDFSGFYLSLNQGVNEFRAIYKTSAKEALESKAVDYANRLSLTGDWTRGKINLALDSGAATASFYESGNIISKFYSKDALPTESTLLTDLLYIIKQYELLFHSDIILVEPEEDDEYFEDKTKYKLHKRIERNSKLAKLVKKKQGYLCKACGIDLEASYPGCGERYIEAHHLTPFSELEIGRVRLDPLKDFTVLCPNCHRMIHRSGHIGDVDGFKVECVRVEYVT
jgi:5-methylcytosine-specific restriction protein A